MTASLRRHITLHAELIGINKAKLVFSLLLKEPTSSRAQRLLWLLEALRKAETLRLQVMRIKSSIRAMAGSSVNLWALTGDPSGKRAIAESNAELRRLVNAINDRLKRYQFTPAIRVAEAEPLRLIESKQCLSKADVEEAIAAGWLVEFASNGRIANFRNCHEHTCQKLFWNEDAKAKFCTPTCRKKFYSSDPEHKLKRNERLKQKRRDERAAAAKEFEDLKTDLQNRRKFPKSPTRRVQ